MKSYIGLAQVYDQLMDHIDYQSVTDFYLKAARKFGWQGKNILDLACGTGNITLQLLQQGFEVLGLDFSEQMLAIADAKIYQAGFIPHLICQNMKNIKIPSQVDLVLCSFDSINYLVKKEEVQQVFNQVFKQLTKEGFFLFDVNSEYKFKEVLGRETFTLVEDNICYIWQNSFSEKSNLCQILLDIFILKPGGLYERIQEEHQQRYYSPEQLTNMLEIAGFQVLAIYGDQTFRKPDETTKRLFFIARKQSE